MIYWMYSQTLWQLIHQVHGQWYGDYIRCSLSQLIHQMLGQWCIEGSRLISRWYIGCPCPCYIRCTKFPEQLGWYIRCWDGDILTLWMIHCLWLNDSRCTIHTQWGGNASDAPRWYIRCMHQLMLIVHHSSTSAWCIWCIKTTGWPGTGKE